MKITKYRHACLFINNGSEQLVIDPGKFTELPDDLSNIRTVVISEEHYDHFFIDNVQKIVKQNPDVQIFTTEAVMTTLKNAGITATAISDAQTVDENGFNITLSEGDHAVVYGKSPNRVLTVAVNDFLYYPSDSFIPSSGSFKVLALPTSGPWHKLSESVDFANAVKSEKILVTHNGLWNEDGNTVANNLTKANIADQTREWLYLEDSQSVDIN